MAIRLDKRSFSEALEYLGERDRQLKLIVSRHGPPPMWERKEGFATLVHIIVEQQVSLASAKAAYEKLLVRIESLRSDTGVQQK